MELWFRSNQKQVKSWKFSTFHITVRGSLIPSQQTFQRCFNVVFCLIQRRDVGQRQINVETTLHISTLEFTTSNNVKSMLYISTLIWNNVRQRRDIVVSTSSFTALVNVETTLWKWPFLKITKQIISNRIHGIQSFSYYFIIFFTLLPILRGICWRVLARPQKLFKDRKRYCISRT